MSDYVLTLSAEELDDLSYALTWAISETEGCASLERMLGQWRKLAGKVEALRLPSVINRLERGREIAGLSIRQVAYMTGLSYDTIAAAETGGEVSAELLATLSDLYEMREDWLIGGYDPTLDEVFTDAQFRAKLTRMDPETVETITDISGGLK